MSIFAIVLPKKASIWRIVVSDMLDGEMVADEAVLANDVARWCPCFPMIS